MRYVLIVVFGAVATFCVLAFQCAKPMQQLSKPSDIGIIWNYSNASTQAYFDLPATRGAAGGIGRPGGAAPVLLQQPCGTWNNLNTVDVRLRVKMLSDYQQGFGRNPCSWCHCNVEVSVYPYYYLYYPYPVSNACVDTTGQTVFWTEWNVNPDSIAIRWRP